MIVLLLVLVGLVVAIAIVFLIYVKIEARRSNVLLAERLGVEVADLQRDLRSGVTYEQLATRHGLSIEEINAVAMSSPAMSRLSGLVGKPVEDE